MKVNKTITGLRVSEVNEDFEVEFTFEKVRNNHGNEFGMTEDYTTIEVISVKDYNRVDVLSKLDEVKIIEDIQSHLNR